MKVLVTGARGQLGRELCAGLRQAGEEVIAPGRDELDLARPDTIDAQVQAQRPDWVVNCAAYTQVDKAEQEAGQAFRVNRDGAGELARASARAGARLLHLSTDFVFGGDQCVPYTEEAPTRPLNRYGQSKLEGEQQVRAQHSGALIVRTAWVYGAGGANFVNTMLRLAAEREELRVVSDQIGTPSWTRDIARALMCLMQRDAGGLYHFTNEGVASWYDFCHATVEEARALGFDLAVKQITPIATRDYPTPAQRPSYSVLDKSRIRPLLGYPIPHWRSSLRAMLKEVSA